MKKVLLYNGLPFHNELFGTFLEYFNEKKWDIHIYTKLDHLGFFDMYKLFFSYTFVSDVNPDIYDLVIVLTDSDWSYTKINKKTICINHWYQKRNNFINKQYPIGPLLLDNGKFNDNFIIPVYSSILNRYNKSDVKHINEIHVCVLGRCIPDDQEELKFLQHTEQKIVFHIINVHGYHPKLKNNPNIKLYDNKFVSTTDLFNILINCEYMFINDTNIEHNNGYTISASIALSLVTGCQLIIPTIMNKHLRLKSPILYDNKKDYLYLDFKQNYDIIKEDLDYCVNKRNKLLDKIILDL